MYYIFVINGRDDMRSDIDCDLKRQLHNTEIQYETYHTTGIGDGIRFVRIYCDLHQNAEVCFIACGGSGTVNEVAQGIFGFRHKSMAIMAYGSTNDLIKYYPDRDFRSLDRIIRGENTRLDIIRANDNYSLNVINCGFDAMVAHRANQFIERGIKGAKGYSRAVTRSVLGNRFNRIRVTADGEKLNRRSILMCTMANAVYCGGQFKCAPYAKVDDGLIDLCLFKTCSMFTFLYLLNHFKDGTHLTDKFCLRNIKYRQVRHVELDSDYLIYLCLDGETTAATHFDIDIIPGAINMVLPSKD